MAEGKIQGKKQEKKILREWRKRARVKKQDGREMHFHSGTSSFGQEKAQGTSYLTLTKKPNKKREFF